MLRCACNIRHVVHSVGERAWSSRVSSRIPDIVRPHQITGGGGGGGRKGGPKTGKPDTKTYKNRNTASNFTIIQKPQQMWKLSVIPLQM